MNRAERRRRSKNVLKRRRKFWDKAMNLGENFTAADRSKDIPIEKFTWLKHTSNPCSCMGCGNPRKHFKDKTVQEKKAEQRFQFELEDVA